MLKCSVEEQQASRAPPRRDRASLHVGADIASAGKDAAVLGERGRRELLSKSDIICNRMLQAMKRDGSVIKKYFIFLNCLFFCCIVNKYWSERSSVLMYSLFSCNSL